MDKELHNEILNASMKNDIDSVKKLLVEINLCKNPKLFPEILGKFKYLSKQAINYKFNNEYNEGLISELFYNSITQNNTDFCKYLIDSKDLRKNANIYDSNLWANSIINGDMDFIKYLAANPKFKKDGKEYIIINALELSTKNKKLDILKYLIDDPTMPHHNEIVQTIKKYYATLGHLTQFTLFSNACGDNNKDWVDFLLEHPEYKQMINNISFYNGLRNAALGNHLEMLDYLLTNESMPFKPYKDYNPQNLLRNKNIPLDIVHYLVFNFKVKKPENLDDFFDTKVKKGWNNIYLMESESKKLSTTIKKFFEQRQLNEYLENSLLKNEIKIKKLKI